MTYCRTGYLIELRIVMLTASSMKAYITASLQLDFMFYLLEKLVYNVANRYSSYIQDCAYRHFTKGHLSLVTPLELSINVQFEPCIVSCVWLYLKFLSLISCVSLPKDLVLFLDQITYIVAAAHI